MALNSKIPAGEMNEKWEDYKGHVKLVNPLISVRLKLLLLVPVWRVLWQLLH